MENIEVNFVGRRSASERLKAFLDAVTEMEDIVKYHPNRFYIPGYGLRIPEHYKRN